MKKETAFIAFMMIYGIVISLLITAVLAGIALPVYTGTILTIEEEEGLELMGRTFGWISENKNLIIPVSTYPLIFIAYILFILNVNPNIKEVTFKRKTGIFKALTVFLIGAGAYLLILHFGKDVTDSGYFPLLSFLDKTLLLKFLVVPLIGGFFWLIAGEMGLAGDFSSWKMGTQEKKPKPFLCFIFGVIVSVAIMGISSISTWAFIKYQILSIQVFGKSDIVSSYGFKLAYGQMFLFSISNGIIAGLIVAFSPIYIDAKDRVKRFIFPGVLIVIMAAAVFGTYKYASSKYDFDKKSLKEAAGLSDKPSLSRTILFFRQDKEGNKLILREWPMTVSYFNPLYTMNKKDAELASERIKNMLRNGPRQGLKTELGEEIIELSYDNLEKIQNYLLDHKDGSVFNSAAEDVLNNGYYTLWDKEKGLEWQFKSLQHRFIQRLSMISRLNYFPKTQQNLKYLKSFADITRWHVKGRFALGIASGFIHFGMPEEAKKWIDRAKESGAEPDMVAGVQIPTGPILTKGKIYGSIKVNGKAPLNTKVAILSFWDNDLIFEDIGSFGMDVNALMLRLIDAKELDNWGTFGFDNLGTGKYFLGLMTAREVIPYDISPEKIKVSNIPEVIELGGNVPVVNVGDIDIAY